MAQTTKKPIFEEDQIRITLMNLSIRVTHITRDKEKNIVNVYGWTTTSIESDDLEIITKKAKEELKNKMPRYTVNVFLSSNTGTIKDKNW